MSFDVGNAVREAWERLATTAGAVVVLALAVVGLVQSVATQDLLRALFESIREPVLEAVREEDPEAETEIAEAFDQALADLPLAMDLSPGVAVLLWLLAFVLTAAIVVVAIDAFASERDRLDGIGVDGLGGKTAHLLAGWLAIGFAVLVGFLFLVVPGLILLVFALVFLPYFPVAIATEGDGFLQSFRRSYGVAREHLVDTVVVLVVVVATVVAANFLGGLLALGLPGLAGAAVAQVFGTLGTVFALAILTRAFLAARASSDASTEPGHDAAATGDEEIHEDW